MKKKKIKYKKNRCGVATKTVDLNSVTVKTDSVVKKKKRRLKFYFKLSIVN